MSRLDKLTGAAKPSVNTDEMNAQAGKNFIQRHLRLDQVVPSKTNTTFNPDDVGPLAESIAADGQVQPILVRNIGGGEDGPFEIIDGETRWNAVKELHGKDPDDRRFKTIRAEVVKCTPVGAKAMQLVANLMRKNLDRDTRDDHYAQLGRDVPLMRKEDPEKWRGKSTDEVIATQMNEMDPAANVKASTVRYHRQQAEARARVESGGTLSQKWVARGQEERIRSHVLEKISERPEAEQLELFEAYEKKSEESGGKAKEWLTLETNLFSADGAESVMRKALDSAAKELSKLERVKEKGYYIDLERAEKLQAAMRDLLGAAQDDSE